jgi:hypothetical protein
MVKNKSGIHFTAILLVSPFFFHGSSQDENGLTFVQDLA